MNNVYLRSELRLGFDAGDWWGAFAGDELTSVVLGWSLVVPYIPDREAATPLAHALAASAQPRMIVGHKTSVMALHNAFRPPRPARELRDPQPLMILDRGDLQGTPSPEVRLSTRDDLEALIVAAARMHREETVSYTHLDVYKRQEPAELQEQRVGARGRTACPGERALRRGAEGRAVESGRMQLFDTARQEVVPFEPRGGQVGIYVCGITPYDSAHLGHAFVYHVFDVLNRRFRDAGLTVRSLSLIHI